MREFIGFLLLIAIALVIAVFFVTLRKQGIDRAITP